MASYGEEGVVDGGVAAQGSTETETVEDIAEDGQENPSVNAVPDVEVRAQSPNGFSISGPQRRKLTNKHNLILL